MSDSEHGPVPKSNPVANMLFLKYIRKQNRSASFEHKVFSFQDLANELLVSSAVAGLICSNKKMNYYKFESLVLENLS